MSLPYHICLLPSAHLEKSHDVGILPAVRYDTTAGFYLVLEKYRTASGITDRISADYLILIVTVHRIKVTLIWPKYSFFSVSTSSMKRSFQLFAYPFGIDLGSASHPVISTTEPTGSI